MTEAIRKAGDLVKAYAFADWDTRRSMAEHLHQLGYDLIHVPDSRDNASDYKMASFIMDHLVHYPETTEYVMVTGDGDFKLIAGALLQRGLGLWLISNPVITASELSDMATKYSDIYSFKPSMLDCSDPEDCAKKGISIESRQIFAVKLQEAIQIVLNGSNKPGVGHVKHVMKSLNPTFDERVVGFDTWMDFIAWAEAEGYVTQSGELPSTILGLPDATIPDATRISEATQKAYDVLVKLVENRVENDETTKIDDIEGALEDEGIDVQNVGYPKIEDFVVSAEKRGFVRVVLSLDDSNNPTIHPVCTVDRLKDSFEQNVTQYFGSSVNVPKPVFLEKIADVLHEAGITLKRLDEYLEDDAVRQKYQSILDSSGIPFLPPFQMLMATVLLGRGLDCGETIARVNDELTPLSITLQCPAK
jgi:hypothetical protein